MTENNNSKDVPVPEQVDSNLTAIIGITIKSFNEKYIDKKILRV